MDIYLLHLTHCQIHFKTVMTEDGHNCFVYKGLFSGCFKPLHLGRHVKADTPVVWHRVTRMVSCFAQV